MGETIGNAWQDIGVNVTFQEAEWATYIGKIVQKQNVNEFTIWRPTATSRLRSTG